MKSHVVFSDSPIGSGSRVETLCGEEVEDSMTVAVWDETAVMAQIEWPISTCRKCIKAARNNRARTYMYAVAERVEA